MPSNSPNSKRLKNNDDGSNSLKDEKSAGEIKCPLRVFFDVPDFFEALKPFICLTTLGRLAKVNKLIRGKCHQQNEAWPAPGALDLHCVDSSSGNIHLETSSIFTKVVHGAFCENVKILRVQVDTESFSDLIFLLRTAKGITEVYIEFFADVVPDISDFELKSLLRGLVRHARSLRSLSLDLEFFPLDLEMVQILVSLLSIACSEGNLRTLNLCYLNLSNPKVSTKEVLSSVLAPVGKSSAVTQLGIQGIFVSATDMKEEAAKYCKYFLEPLKHSRSLEKLDFCFRCPDSVGRLFLTPRKPNMFRKLDELEELENEIISDVVRTLPKLESFSWLLLQGANDATDYSRFDRPFAEIRHSGLAVGSADTDWVSDVGGLRSRSENNGTTFSKIKELCLGLCCIPMGYTQYGDFVSLHSSVDQLLKGVFASTDSSAKKTSLHLQVGIVSEVHSCYDDGFAVTMNELPKFDKLKIIRYGIKPCESDSDSEEDEE